MTTRYTIEELGGDVVRHQIVNTGWTEIPVRFPAPSPDGVEDKRSFALPPGVIGVFRQRGGTLTEIRESTMTSPSAKSSLVRMYQSHHANLAALVLDKQGNSPIANHVREAMIGIWNKMSPADQKKIATQYLPEY